MANFNKVKILYIHNPMDMTSKHMLDKLMRKPIRVELIDGLQKPTPYNVSVLPTVIIIDENGAELRRIENPKQMYENRLRSVAEVLGYEG